MLSGIGEEIIRVSVMVLDWSYLALERALFEYQGWYWISVI